MLATMARQIVCRNMEERCLLDLGLEDPVSMKPVQFLAFTAHYGREDIPEDI